MMHAHGEMYYGQFKHGKKEGYGLWLTRQGQSYNGEWVSNARHGKGVSRERDGCFTEGTWKLDKFDGIMTFTYPDETNKVEEWNFG